AITHCSSSLLIWRILLATTLTLFPYTTLFRSIDMYKYDWIWDKVKGTGFLNAKKQPMRSHEIISVFYKRQCKYHPQMTENHVRRSEEHTSELQSRFDLVCRLLLEKKKEQKQMS